MVNDSIITKTMMYIGPIPVKVDGLKPLPGKKQIDPGDILPVPETIAYNLARDPNWVIMKPIVLENMEKSREEEIEKAVENALKKAAAEQPQAGQNTKAGDDQGGDGKDKEKKK